MSARFSSAHCGTPMSCASILQSLIIFSNAVFSQTIDATFAPLLQDFGSTQNRAKKAATESTVFNSA